jgi:transposase InsO family protein
VFEHFRSLALRLNNENPDCLKAIHSDNGTEFRNASFDQFCLTILINSSLSRVFLNRMESWNERIAL